MLRKILRFTNRHIKYSNRNETELELRIYLCKKINQAKIPVRESPVLLNLYQGQQKKIYAVLAKLPEDLQSDYANALGAIS